MKRTFAAEINRALRESFETDDKFVLGGQLIKYGVAGLTAGLYEDFSRRMITYPVAESLMNSSAMGLALAGHRVAMIHVRIDFLASGMCALTNHIPIWYKKGVPMPIVFICQIGRGMGQGAQHSKDLTPWFENFEGWSVKRPLTPEQAYEDLRTSLKGDGPTIYAIHRELFDATGETRVRRPGKIELCGASRAHENEFYKNI